MDLLYLVAQLAGLLFILAGSAMCAAAIASGKTHITIEWERFRHGGPMKYWRIPKVPIITVLIFSGTFLCCFPILQGG